MTILLAVARTVPGCCGARIQRSMAQFRHRFRRSVFEFLALPVLIVFAFVFLAEAVDWLDNHAGPRMAWGPLRVWLSQYVGDTQSAIGVLTAIAGSLFTVTSVTFSILLLAVQQGATVLNSQIIDHYLRRRSNRAWFGFFAGVSVFVLITLVQTTHTKAPIFGVTVSTLLGAATLTALIILIYATVDQTRPSTVIHAIATAAMAARETQTGLLRLTAPLPPSYASGILIRALQTGYLTTIHAEKLQAALATKPGTRLYLTSSVGDYLPQGAPLALVEGESAADLTARLSNGFALSAERDVATDPAASLNHLATIGWTAISTAHSDPAVGAIAVNTLQRLLHFWAYEPERSADGQALMYYQDRLPEQTVSALEDLMIAATESRQHQTMALILRALSTSIPLLAGEQRNRLCRLVNTAVIALKEHIPSQELQRSVAALSATLDDAAEAEAASKLRGTLREITSAA